MKISNKEAGWESKVNFVDENDVFLGYDTAQDCCEDAGWFISDKEDEPYSCEGNKSFTDNTEGYVFDTEYMNLVDSSDLDDGGQVCFKITHKGKQDLFIHLYNSHNGYYGHGFTFTVDGKKVKEDCL